MIDIRHGDAMSLLGGERKEQVGAGKVFAALIVGHGFTTFGAYLISAGSGLPFADVAACAIGAMWCWWGAR